MPRDRADEDAVLLARYLVGREPEPELIARYREAVRTTWPTAPPPREAALVAFVRRHPWSLGPLDAAAALVQPAGRLRGTVLVMSAILETSPAFADDFLPQSAPLGSTVLRLVRDGTVAVAKAAVGLLLYPVAARAPGGGR